jgi:hypothetical protein
MFAWLLPLAAMPWLQGFFAPEATSERPRGDVITTLAEWRAPDEACVGSAYGGLLLRADVVPGGLPERILASYSQGVFVLDDSHRLLAQAPGFPCEGSADALVAIAVGDVLIGAPVVALAATTGGHAENMTWLTLYRVSPAGELQPVFIGEIERHEEHATYTGTVVIVPGGLVHRDPAGALSFWIYEPTLGRYIEWFTTRPYA